MLRMRARRQRGQMLPFWALAVTCLIALTFFLANYASVLTWQIRAQNAADSAASVGMSVQGSVFNQESTILYSMAVDENRIRFLNQAILNTIYGEGGCANQSGACAGDYTSLVGEFNQAVTAYQNDMQLIQRANNFTEGGQQADQMKALRHIGDCTVTDCAFSYTVINTGSGGGTCEGHSCGTAPQEIDVVACHRVPLVAGALFGLGANGAFTAVGRAAAMVSPSNAEVFSPGTAVNPSTNQVYQPIEPQWASLYPSPAYTVDYSGLQVHVNWYAVAPIAPYSGPIATGSYTCS
ncbi:MAG TPA: pilus assembly protein TadG-related protein [Candidatus Dormibacteraeota bacterium]|nr:pilus assembly protein TadG-related protein [Candidatus Dormibacteraeota bacterium]